MMQVVKQNAPCAASVSQIAAPRLAAAPMRVSASGAAFTQLRPLLRAPRAPLRAAPRLASSKRAGGIVLAAASTAGQVYVPDASGQLGARIIKELLLAGCKVTAGVPDLDEGRELVSMASKLELLPSAALKGLTLVEVAGSEDVAANVPKRGARVVVVLGDTVEGRKADPRRAERILQVLLDDDAPALSQVVLVNAQRGGGGTGLLGGFGGGGGKGLTKLEEAVLNADVPCVVLRLASTDADPDLADVTSVVFADEPGAIPNTYKITQGQAAAAAAQLLLQARGSVFAEAAADVPEDGALLAVEESVATLLESVGDEAPPPPPPPTAAAAAAASSVLGTLKVPALPKMGAKAPVQEEVEVEEEEEEPKPPQGRTLFGIAAPKLPTPPAVTKSGTQKTGTQSSRAAGTQSSRGAGTQSSRAAGTQSSRAAGTQSSRAAKKAPPPPPAPKKAPPAKKGGSDSDDEDGKKGGGLLSAFGFGQKTAYVDEL